MARCRARQRSTRRAGREDRQRDVRHGLENSDRASLVALATNEATLLQTFQDRDDAALAAQLGCAGHLIERWCDSGLGLALDDEDENVSRTWGQHPHFPL